jgi:circadian clock protein KaiA
LRSPLSLCILDSTDAFAQFLSPFLGETAANEAAQRVRYAYRAFASADSLLQYIRQAEQPVDCLILPIFAELQPLLDQLQQQALFFPTVVVEFPASVEGVQPNGALERKEILTQTQFAYHSAVMLLTATQINQIGLTIDQAISKFLQLSPDGALVNHSTVLQSSPTHRLMAQQLRLAEKLKERLDYLGVYYKRDPHNFLRRMSPSQKEELLQQLSADYRTIVLAYFTDEPGLNDKIDQFVNVAFFADVPIAQVVAIHMDLMDELSKHLKIEGRSDEILLDYRLTLIDTLAHLCEMYRRSIPRES